MRLSELFETIVGCDVEITSIAFDTREVPSGSLFFCLVGNTRDGHDFLPEAVKNGAVAAVVEKSQPISIPQIVVGDARHALAIAAKKFYGSAADRLSISAVTGTNGKTTTTYILKSIFEANGKTVGLIGTNEVSYCGKICEASLTTPDPTEFHRTLADMENCGVTHVVAEASAHALALRKLDGIKFAAVGFTNLTRDHLDYFGNMSSYGATKASLFDGKRSRAEVINIDDEFGAKLYAERKGAITYGRRGLVSAENVEYSSDGTKFTLKICDERAEAHLSLPGKYNLYNALCAAGMAFGTGISVGDIARGLSLPIAVKGRFETVKSSRGTVIIDYAHTDDGLDNLLKAVREIAKGRIITVFGCGGNRDKTKRPLMWKAAADRSDFVVLTSDNPRFEKPENIISDVLGGIKIARTVEYSVQPDRHKAIETALTVMENGDIVVIAGKGAEKYQEINGTKYPFDDKKIVEKLLAERN